jgi:mannose-6-phosphate isomerase-like protein (cupin superfamily)
MGAAFALDHSELESHYAGLARKLSAQTTIDSNESFNRYCQNACRFWREQFPNGIGTTSSQFHDLQKQIASANAGVIKTSWGGVVVILHEHPRVEKFLVVKEGGYLALEKHEQKDEHLQVREGAGLLLWRSSTQAPLTVETLAPGKSFHFAPGLEHCLIGAENLLVFERSTDPKGMDRDLIFIYEPEATA